MPEQSKFEDVDLFASLNAVMKQNTGFYQSDLEIDKEIIAKAAASPRKEDKTLLWFCRPSGTHCFIQCLREGIAELNICRFIGAAERGYEHFPVRFVRVFDIVKGFA